MFSVRCSFLPARTGLISLHPEIKPEVKFIIATGSDYGWTTNLPLADFLADDALIADLHDGEPLDPDHGAPARLMIPQFYAGKSAKWLRRLTLVEHDQPGDWEQGGAPNHGNPWTEERFGGGTLLQSTVSL